MENTPLQPQPPSTSKLPIILSSLLVLAVIAAGGSMFIAYNALQKVTMLEEQIAASSETTQTETKKKMPTQEGAQVELQTFTDPNVEGMSFQYDPTYWEVIESNSENKKLLDETGADVYLKEKSGNGNLVFSYTLEFGMGGGYALFESSKISDVTDTLSRIQSSNTYQYGLKKHLVNFSNSPDEKTKIIDFCKEMIDPDYQGMTIFNPDECDAVNSGKIIGYAPQPTYSWSLKRKILTTLKDINPQWDGDAYVESEGLDNGMIIVTTTYTGDNPEEADKIVKQLKF